MAAPLLGADLATAPTSPLRLAIVEDDVPVRELLHQYLCRNAEFECVAVVGSVEALWAELDLCLPPHLILLDINLPGQSGLQALPQLVKRLPAAGILLQTLHDEAEYIYQALQHGARGYVLKSATPLAGYRQALLDVAQGGMALSPSVARQMLAYFKPRPSLQSDLLSPRECQVLEALVEGLSERQVAAQLDVSMSTVHTYVRRLYDKLQVKSRAELLGRSLKGGL